jgi:TM2 domain-containing membrane protein YozV
MSEAERRPFVALVLSLALPGLGQVYNTQHTKGQVIAGVCLTFALGIFWLSGLNRLSVLLALVLVWISAVVDAYKTAQTSGQPLEWYYRYSYVVAMLLLVGPLALPLLWRSPYFSRTAQWVWSTAVVGVAILFFATPYLFHWLVQKMPELEAVLRQSGVHL